MSQSGHFQVSKCLPRKKGSHPIRGSEGAHLQLVVQSFLHVHLKDEGMLELGVALYVRSGEGGRLQEAVWSTFGALPGTLPHICSLWRVDGTKQRKVQTPFQLILVAVGFTELRIVQLLLWPAGKQSAAFLGVAGQMMPPRASRSPSYYSLSGISNDYNSAYIAQSNYCQFIRAGLPRAFHQ